MIDIWFKLASAQFEFALNLTRAVFGIYEREAPVSVHSTPKAAEVSGRVDVTEAKTEDEPGQQRDQQEERLATAVPVAGILRETDQISVSGAGESPGLQIESQTCSDQPRSATVPEIMSFLESTNRGATVREIAEHLKMDKKIILPLLKTLVKERKIDELLGRYGVLKS